jgi:hypothetical protein
MAVFGAVAPCGLVEVYGRFSGAYCLHNKDEHRLDDGAASTAETQVNVYQTALWNIPKKSHLHTRRREKLKSRVA